MSQHHFFSKRTLLIASITIVLATLAACSGDSSDLTAPGGAQVAAPALSKSTTFGGCYFGQTINNGYRNVPIKCNYYKWPNGQLVGDGVYTYVDKSGNVFYSSGTGLTLTGKAHECVEYIGRVMQVLYQQSIPAGDAGDMWKYEAHTVGGSVQKVTNGMSSVLPEPGDILVQGDSYNGFPTSGPGHVSIYSGANAQKSAYTYFEQNVTKFPTNSKSISAKRLAGSTRYSLEAIGSANTDARIGYYMKGWFSHVAHPRATPVVSAVSPASTRASSTAMKLTMNTSGIVDLNDLVVLVTDPTGKKTNTFTMAANTVTPTADGVTVTTALAIAGTWSVSIKTGLVPSAVVKFNMTK